MSDDRPYTTVRGTVAAALVHRTARARREALRARVQWRRLRPARGAARRARRARRERRARSATGIPAVVHVAVTVVLWLALVAVMALLGRLLTEILVPHLGVGLAERSYNDWLEEHRAPLREDISWIGSTLSGGLVIPLVVAVTCIWLAFRRRWRLAAFFLTAILVEVTAYRAIVALVPRERPGGRPPREPSAPAQLPIRARGRLGRRVRSSRARPRLASAGLPLALRGLPGRNRAPGLRRGVAHVSRDAQPDGRARRAS